MCTLTEQKGHGSTQSIIPGRRLEQLLLSGKGMWPKLCGGVRLRQRQRQRHVLFCCCCFFNVKGIFDWAPQHTYITALFSYWHDFYPEDQNAATIHNLRAHFRVWVGDKYLSDVPSTAVNCGGQQREPLAQKTLCALWHCLRYLNRSHYRNHPHTFLYCSLILAMKNPRRR